MLHINSILFSLAVVQIIMAAVLLTFWATHAKTLGLREMAAAMTVGGAGALLAGIGASALNPALILFGPICFVIGVLLAARSMRRLQGRESRHGLEFASIIIAVTVDYHFIINEHRLSGVFVVNSLIYVVVCGLTARDLLAETDPSIQRGCRILGVIFAAFAAVNLFRAILRPLIVEGPGLQGQVVNLDHLAVFFGMAVTIGWSLGLLWTAYSRAEYQLRAANRELERFSGAVAHDLKSPLNAVIGYLEAIKHPSTALDPGQTARFIESAHEAAVGMNGFIHDLLDHARSVQSATQAEAVDTARCIEIACQRLRSQIDAVGAEIATGPLPAVAANPLQVTRVFQNLLDNALKYRAEDRVLKIDVSSERKGADHYIFLKDNGVGISPDDQVRVFDRFERAHPASAVAGNGIGLSECQRILEHYGGSIEVESTPDLGSTFIIRLPAGSLAN